MSTCLEADCLSVRCMSSLAEDRGPSDGAAAALFAAGIAARPKGKVIWCLTRPDLFPALAQAGLQPDRVVFVEATRRNTCLLPWRRPFRSAVSERSAELVRLPMTASRRLQLSAEKREPWVRSFDVGGDRRRPPTSANRPRQRPGGV